RKQTRRECARVVYNPSDLYHCSPNLTETPRRGTTPVRRSSQSLSVKRDPICYAALFALAYIGGVVPRFQRFLPTVTTKEAEPSMNILNWLNTNSGAVQGVAACVTVGITGVLAWLTFRYTRLTHSLVQLQTDPAVEVRFGPDMMDNTLIIENNGVHK